MLEPTCSCSTTSASKDIEWVGETLGLVINTRYNARRDDRHQQPSRPLDNTDMNSFMVQLGGGRARPLEMCEWVECRAPTSAASIASPRRQDRPDARRRNASKEPAGQVGGMARARLKDAGVQYEQIGRVESRQR
jgi:hypothetical protein